jgi:GT2 family glycosyltransferase
MRPALAPPARAPDVSVVIPTTARRETRLAFALEALACQTLTPERFEVIVVRARHAGPKATAPPRLAVSFLAAPPGSGAAASRNIGWRAASAPLVAFTDDDCRPAPGWLERLVVAARRGEGSVLQGRTEPDPGELERLHGLATTQRIDGPTAWYQTCNIAYPRALLERLGGFDERFNGGEDADLGLRAIEAGARREFVDDACVWHAVHSRHIWDAVRDHARWNTIPLVVAEHPSQRQALELRLFWRARHARVVLAALGLLRLRRHPALGLAASMPYLLHHLKAYRLSPRTLARAALDLPPRAIVDVTGVAATAGSAIRYRTPVL